MRILLHQAIFMVVYNDVNPDKSALRPNITLLIFISLPFNDLPGPQYFIGANPDEIDSVKE